MVTDSIYSLIDIRITIMCVNVSSTTTTLPLQLISIFTIHTDIYLPYVRTKT